MADAHESLAECRRRVDEMFERDPSTSTALYLWARLTHQLLDSGCDPSVLVAGIERAVALHETERAQRGVAGA